ncbi:MAG: hypothetical protein H7239_08625 [Flavobacterium sp.]|nr:hypothetical protein [Flavobacterium sp.]
MSSYLKTSDEEIVSQVDNFSSKIESIASKFAITPAEVASIQNDAKYLTWAINSYFKVDTNKKNWTSFKNILKDGEANVTSNSAPTAPALDQAPEEVAPGVLVRFTTMVNRIKAHPRYTTAIGQDLGIEMTTNQQLDVNNAKPTLKVVFTGGRVNLQWKKGKFDGILIEKDNGAGFITLDKDLHPNFIDPSPMPAQGESALWRYRAIYLLNDAKVGQWSDIVTTSVVG